MKKIVIDRDIPFLRGVFEPFAATEYRAGADIRPEAVRDADALIIRTRTRCNAALLDGSQVKMIATATIGFDHIDLEYCRSRGIETATAAGCNARGVLQWVSAVLAMLARTDRFAPSQRVLGIVGVGNVGGLVREYAERWGFRTICCDPPREEREHCGFVPLEQVLRTADIVTLHTPLDASTHHMLDGGMLRLMRPGAVLINASRGEVVCTQALLDSGLRFAADVWEHEPDIDRTMLARALAATPHIAGYSLQGKANASALGVRAVAKRFGLPLTHWYPEEVQQTVPRAIAWEEMCGAIGDYCDLQADSEALRRAPESFEALRSGYRLRQEFF